MRKGKKNILYGTYKSMLRRCYDEKHDSFPKYGGRGIKVDESWLGEEGIYKFFEDMEERPTGCTLDRIENDSGYSKDNCRWANNHEQASNKSNSNKFVGVSFRKQRNKFRAYLSIDGVRVLNKSFSSFEEACSVRKSAEIQYGIYQNPS